MTSSSSNTGTFSNGASAIGSAASAASISPSRIGSGELARIAGAQLQRHGGIAAVVFAERTGQPHGRRALHGAQPQQAAGVLLVHGLASFAGKIQQAVGVAEQRAAGGRHVHALALADEELHAQVLFQLADARRDVGLHPMQLLGGAGDAAGADDSAENVQVDQIHRSQSKMIIIIIIHFLAYMRICKASLTAARHRRR